MKHILLIATGGTICCRDTGNGLAPALTGEELLAFLPGIASICCVTVCDLFSMDSTDITARERLRIAACIRENYEKYDGFVVTHGTDSMAYSAALLAHLCKNLRKPVILTGSQKPIGVPDSDAERNLTDALRVAASDCIGVAAVMYGKIIGGEHLVKVHSSDPEGFASINAPLRGTINADGVHLADVPAPCGAPAFVETIDANVMLLKLLPDMDPALFTFLEQYDKVILEAFGAGGLPARLEQAVQKLIASGTRVYITTQCVAGGVDLSVYEVGRRAEALGAVSLGKRTIEDAVAAIQCGDI